MKMVKLYFLPLFLCFAQQSPNEIDIKVVHEKTLDMLAEILTFNNLPT